MNKPHIFVINFAKPQVRELQFERKRGYSAGS